MTVLTLVAHPFHATDLGIGMEMLAWTVLKPSANPPFGTG